MDVAEVNQRCWLEESEQWLETVDQTHLALTSGKPVSSKKKNLCLVPDDTEPDRRPARHDGRGREAAEGHQHLRQGLPGLRRLQTLTNNLRRLLK